MADPVSSIPNLGPAAGIAFARAGITSAAALRDMGADAAYLAFLRAGGSAHFIGYYALVMGLQGRPWNDCKGAEKDALRARFDSLKSQVNKTPAGIESILDEIGTGVRRG
ncbi:MAG: TfoX/Sxy family DNA transformation protein [Pseudooceanicola sp.]